MKQIAIADMTLVQKAHDLSFKEKIEIARHLDNLLVDVIELPELEAPATDALMIHTISAFVKHSVLSVGTGLSLAGVQAAAEAIANAKHGRLRLCVPVSTVQMEYRCHQKPAKLLELCDRLFAEACRLCRDVELVALDATRADMEFFRKLAALAAQRGVSTLTLCDDEGILLPDEIVVFLRRIREELSFAQELRLAALCGNAGGMATANALMVIKDGIDEVKTAVGSGAAPQTGAIAGAVHQLGHRLNAQSSLNCDKLHRITHQIEWILGRNAPAEPVTAPAEPQAAPLDVHDTQEDVIRAVRALGYDLTAEDCGKVYEEFLRMAGRKTVDSRELEAIVANVALQVPPTYVLESYVINSGNVLSSSAQIKLKKNGQTLGGVCLGDGPVDAAFMALEQIVGRHFELDDFQIQSVTEGREAMGVALVRLRHQGKLYSGRGISTDIIGSSVRAYLNAVNKIVYEEA